MFSDIANMFKFLFIGVPALLVFIVIVSLAASAIRKSKWRRQNMDIYTYIKELDNFSAHRIYVDAFSETAIAFSEDKRSVLRAEFKLYGYEEQGRFSPKYLKIYDMSQVISADLIEDTVTKTSTSGYTMFSDTWVFANSTSRKQIRELVIRILFDDSQNPRFSITLFKMPYSSQDFNSQRTDSDVYFDIAQELYTDLHYLMHKSKQDHEVAQKPKPILPIDDSSPVLPNSSETVKAVQTDDTQRMEEQKGGTSLIESIERISHLKAQGLITEEEFVLLKTKLLTASTPPEA